MPALAAVPPAPSPAPGNRHLSLELALAFGATLALITAINFRHVPYNNEYLYLLFPYRFSHPGFLSGDWTFSRFEKEHFLFNLLIGLPMRALPLEAVGWAGRLICWALLVLGLIRLGGHFGLRPWVAAVGIVLWQHLGGALYGGEWLFDSFEAKVPAYVLAIFGIDALLRDRIPRAGLLLGLAFSLHPSVGLSAGIAATAGLILHDRRREVLESFGRWGALGAAPGLAVVLPLGIASQVPGDMWRIICDVLLPMHLDPGSWERGPIILSGLMLGFNVLHCLNDPALAARRFFLGFELALGTITGLGFLAFAAGFYRAMTIYPFRVFPLLVILLFLFHLFRALEQGLVRTARPVPLLLAVIVLIRVPEVNPSGIRRELRARLAEWREPPDDLDQTMLWVRNHTPPNVVVIAPPWRKETFYYTRRPQAAHLYMVNEHLVDWRRRVERVLGPLATYRSDDEEAMQAAYDSLSRGSIELIRRDLGADLLISRTRYRIPVLYHGREYRVYDLRGWPAGGERTYARAAESPRNSAAMSR